MKKFIFNTSPFTDIMVFFVLEKVLYLDQFRLNVPF